MSDQDFGASFAGRVLIQHNEDALWPESQQALLRSRWCHRDVPVSCDVPQCGPAVAHMNHLGLLHG